MTRPPRTPPRTAFEAIYTRAQVEWAIWRRIAKDAKRKPTSAFKVRIKHLLEFDRSEPLKGADIGMAFSDNPPGGRGEHGLFSVYDALFLDIGLGLLDLGFKRKEVVLLLRRRRGALRHDLGATLMSGAKFRAGPILVADPDPMREFNRIALLLPRIEDLSDRAARRFDHLVCRGPQEISKAVEDRAFENLIIIDLSQSTYLLPSLLLQAPAARRGRGGA